MYRQEFTIQTVPMTLNQALRSHWSKYSRESKKIEIEIRQALFKKMPEKPLKKAIVTIWRYSSGELDRDNSFYTYKHILDSLVRLGVLENDKMENVITSDPVQIKIKRTEKKKLMITVEETSDRQSAV